MRLIGVSYPAACSHLNSLGYDTRIASRTSLVNCRRHQSRSAAAAAWRHNSCSHDS